MKCFFNHVQFRTLMFLAHIPMLCDNLLELEKLEVADYQNGIKTLIAIKCLIAILC